MKRVLVNYSYPGRTKVRLSKTEKADLPALLASVAHLQRPRTRGDCAREARPCPWVSCRYHLYLDVNRKTGSVTLNVPGEPWEITESCALDVADRGRATLEAVGALIGVTRERTRQLEEITLAKLLAAFGADYLRDLLP